MTRTCALQSALESGSAEGLERAAQLDASLAETQSELREAQDERQAAQERLEELQETLYNQVGYPLCHNSIAWQHVQLLQNPKGMSRASRELAEQPIQGKCGTLQG